MLVNKCNCLLVGVIEVYFDVNDCIFSGIEQQKVYVMQ